MMDASDMVRKQCGECGVEFWMPRVLEDECVKRGRDKGWHCPNGHERFYIESAADKLRRELDRAKQQIAQRDDEIKTAREGKDKAEKKAARLIKRVNAGVCPCCNRTFINLQRHMATKHGDTVVPLKRA